MDQDEHGDFIYGFTDCGVAVQSGLNMGQYEDFVSRNVSASHDSVPKLIRIAPHRLKVSPPLAGGEIWTERHGFLNGDIWGPRNDEKRAYIEGYMACEGRPVYLQQVDRYVQLIDRHYANPKRHLDKIANVLEPLLPAKVPTTTP